jgi:hypothetical protein
MRPDQRAMATLAADLPATIMAASSESKQKWMLRCSAGAARDNGSRRDFETAPDRRDQLARWGKVGAGDGNRTHDIQLGKLSFYH